MFENSVQGPIASTAGVAGSVFEPAKDNGARAVVLGDEAVSKIKERRARKRWQCTNPFCKHHNPMEMLLGSELDRTKRGAMRCPRCESDVVAAIKDGVPVRLSSVPSSVCPLDADATIRKSG